MLVTVLAAVAGPGVDGHIVGNGKCLEGVKIGIGVAAFIQREGGGPGIGNGPRRGRGGAIVGQVRSS